MHVGTERANIANSVPVWGSFSGTGKLIRKVSGRLDTVQYKGFLNQVIRHFKSESNTPLKLVHDRYPVHYAAATRKWLEDNRRDIEVLKWPGSFGDVMPMETIWRDLLEILNNRSVTDSNSLWSEIVDSWEVLLTDDYVTQLTTKVPRLLQNIIDNCGDWAT